MGAVLLIGIPLVFRSRSYLRSPYPIICITGSTSQDHPLMEGVTDFTVRDEHYNCEIVAKDIQALFTTHSATGGDRVGAYIRKVGAGEVIVSMPGHLVSVFEEPSYRRFLLNVLAYGGGEHS